MHKILLRLCLLIALIAAPLAAAWAQAGSLIPNARQTFYDANGFPLVGGTVSSYIPSTLTPKATWADPALSVLNPTTITLDSLGSTVMWGFGQYRQIVKDALGNIIWDGITLVTSGAPSGGVIVYVDHTNGSDANLTCTSTGTGACKTIYHAYQVIQTSLRPGITGQVTIQSDCGFTESPPGAFLGNSHTGGTGGGVVFIIGNETTPASCSWATAGLTFDDGAVVSLRGFDLTSSGGSVNLLTSSKQGLLVFANMIFSNAGANGVLLITSQGGVIVWDGGSLQFGNVTCAPNCFAAAMQDQGGTFEIDNIATSINVPAPMTFQAFYNGINSGSYSPFGPGVTFTGAGAGGLSTGQEYDLSFNATLRLNGVRLPGNGKGKLGSGACVDQYNFSTFTNCAPKIGSTLFADAPICNGANKGYPWQITDSPVINVGAPVTVGGGGNTVIAMCDGASYKILLPGVGVAGMYLQNVSGTQEGVWAPVCHPIGGTSLPAAVQALQPINTPQFYGGAGYTGGVSGSMLAQYAGTVRDLFVSVDTNPGGTDTAQFISSTNLQCSIPTGNTSCSDTSGSQAVSLGQSMNLKYTTANSGAPRGVTWSAQLCTP